MGLLIVRGTLRVKQFWPDGKSDADTATIVVVLHPTSPFTYVTGGGNRRRTRAFENAEVKGQYGRLKVIKSNKISVRLQGIDAPELHFLPRIKNSAGENGNFRQNLGETCAHALHAYLASRGVQELECEFRSRVTKPAEVCDVYGRFVGNVEVGPESARVDLNHMLLREGWAMPGLYNSMTHDEIRQIQADHDFAWTNGRGLFSANYVTGRLARFKPTQRYRKGPKVFTPFRDKGPVSFPKFFRRQADHYVRRALGESVPAKFRDYVATKPADIALAVNTFLSHTGSTTTAQFKQQFKQLATFIENNKYPTGPELVFWEADADLFKAGTNTPIISW